MQKTVKYLKIQASSWSENSIEYYLSIKEYFATFFSRPKHIPQAWNENNRWIS